VFHSLMELKRKRERIMSICLTWFLISGLGKPKLYQNMWCFTRKWVGCGGVPVVDGVCETCEIVKR